MEIQWKHAVDLLIAASPEFRSQRRAELKAAGEVERTLYEEAASLAHHLVGAYENGESTYVAGMFSLLERLIAKGNDEVQQFATIGVLEDIQNIGSHRPFGADAFVPMLGPLSQRAWYDLADRWAGKKRLADLVLAEAGSPSHPHEDEPPPPASISDPALRRLMETITRGPNGPSPRRAV